MRSAYGSQSMYQSLSLDAIKAWDLCTEELRRGGSEVPPGMTSQDDIWINNGDLSCTDPSTLPPFEKATIENMDKAGYCNTQLMNNNNNNKEHLRLAEQRGLTSNMQPFSKKLLGVLDTTGGITMADKACRFALHKAKPLGVHLLLDPVAEKVTATVQGQANKIVGARTANGETHQAALTIMACGEWTPSLVPSLDGFAGERPVPSSFSSFQKTSAHASRRLRFLRGLSRSPKELTLGYTDSLWVSMANSRLVTGERNIQTPAPKLTAANAVFPSPAEPKTNRFERYPPKRSRSFASSPKNTYRN